MKIAKGKKTKCAPARLHRAIRQMCAGVERAHARVCLPLPECGQVRWCSCGRRANPPICTGSMKTSYKHPGTHARAHSERR